MWRHANPTAVPLAAPSRGGDARQAHLEDADQHSCVGLLVAMSAAEQVELLVALLGLLRAGGRRRRGGCEPANPLAGSGPRRARRRAMASARGAVGRPAAAADPIAGARPALTWSRCLVVSQNLQDVRGSSLNCCTWRGDGSGSEPKAGAALHPAPARCSPVGPAQVQGAKVGVERLVDLRVRPDVGIGWVGAVAGRPGAAPGPGQPRWATHVGSMVLRSPLARRRRPQVRCLRDIAGPWHAEHASRRRRAAHALVKPTSSVSMQ